MDKKKKLELTVRVFDRKEIRAAENADILLACIDIYNVNTMKNSGILANDNGYLIYASQKIVVAKTVQDGDVAGYLALLQNGNQGYVNLVAVNPIYKRRGVGKALYKYVEQELGVTHLELHVGERNTASQKFHKSLGYYPKNDLPYPVWKKNNQDCGK